MGTVKFGAMLDDGDYRLIIEIEGPVGTKTITFISDACYKELEVAKKAGTAVHAILSSQHTPTFYDVKEDDLFNGEIQ